MMIDRRTLLMTGAAAIAASVPGVAALARPLPQSDPAAKAALDALYARLWDAELAGSPQLATTLGLDDAPVLAPLRSRLDDRSDEAFARHMQTLRDARTTLKGIDVARLDGIDRVSHRTLAFFADITLEGYDRFAYGEPGYPRAYAINQLDGVYNNIPDFLDTKHVIEEAADAEAYCERLGAFARVLDQETARSRRDAGRGAAAPDFILDTCIRQLTLLRAPAPAEAMLTQSVVRRAAAAGISGDWQRRAAGLVEREVYPALDRQIAELKRQRATANHDAGAWRLPDGEAYYDWGIRLFNTKPFTGDEIHRLGLEMVAENRAAIEAILRADGKTTGPLGDRITAMARERGAIYANSDAGRAKMLEDATRQIAEITALLPRYFRTIPRAPVVAKRIPPAIEAGKAGGYYSHGSIDGKVPGSYYINMRDMADRSIVGLATLTHHEAVPGHHMQISLSLENEAIPMWRRNMECSAFVEGWALYAQLVADEMGIFADDPLGKLGFLQSELFRAARLVVDSGLNHKRWSREKAIDYMVDATGSSRDAVTSEVDRYCLIPGQAPSYKIGQREWSRLRGKAQAALGARFDVRDFHDAGLLAGIMPLGVLDMHIEDWIAARRA
ncbi:DUF885 domain-containing protein [Sphingomonas baiyangensis]|uniref:DUF885 family protein n=1 Tax=Sphingomonas baiyangensis TaxID=2572576 RepID=A0A4U1L3Z2_9SPHN|nr:DUF885 family protein [Sphingomonas baiyangensis]TKD51627.1 DUF885 family protein [Sphingomonas baiyangensis]